MTYVSTVSNLPEKARVYMIMTDSSISVPGHGYPAYSHSYLQVQVFESEEEWKKEIEKLIESKYSSFRKTFRAFVCDPATVSTTVEVQVG